MLWNVCVRNGTFHDFPDEIVFGFSITFASVERCPTNVDHSSFPVVLWTRAKSCACKLLSVEKIYVQQKLFYCSKSRDYLNY